MNDYRGFKYWLVETKSSGDKVWRIQFPDGGHKTPPLVRTSEADVKADIDKLIVDSGS